jgi:hypothetical protein
MIVIERAGSRLNTVVAGSPDFNVLSASAVSHSWGAPHTAETNFRSFRSFR